MEALSNSIINFLYQNKLRTARHLALHYDSALDLTTGYCLLIFQIMR